MDKQEVIERLNNKLDEVFAFQRSFKPLTGAHMECESKANAYMTAINYVEQLDEPLKVKVPEEFDEWYQQIKQRWGKSATDFALWKICQFGFGNGFEDVNNDRTSSTLSDWVCWNKEVAINAVWNGYEVEEEPKWVVKYKPGNLDNNWYFIGFCGGDRTLQPNCANRIDCNTVIKFKDRSKAEAVATLIDGTVEKV